MKPFNILCSVVILSCITACAGSPVAQKQAPEDLTQKQTTAGKLAPAEEKEPETQARKELGVEDFVRQWTEALSQKENKKIALLILNNPNTAKKAQLVLEKAGEGEGEGKTAEFARQSAGILSKAMQLIKERTESGGSSEQAEMDGLQVQGEQAYHQAQYAAAIEKWRQGLEMAKKSGNQKYISRFISSIGVVYRNLGQYAKALAFYEQALAIDREIGYRQGEGNNLTNIGVVYDDLGQYEKALAYYEQALAISREIGHRQGESANLGNIGNVYQYLGQYEKALAYYEQALAISREIGDRRGESADLGNIGIVYDHLGQYEKALAYYEQALVILREISDRRWEGADLGNIGIVYTKLGQYEKALASCEQALSIRQEIGDRGGEGADLTNIGILYYILGQNEKALSYYDQSIAIDREIGDRRGEGADITNIGVVYDDMGQYEKAEQSFSESLAICEEVGAPETLWRSQRGLASVEARQNKGASAVTHYEQALDTIESMREGITDKEAKMGFMSDKLYVYDEFIVLLKTLHQKHPHKGYDRRSIEIFERKQGRIFLEEMGQSGARNFAGIPDAVPANENELAGRLAKLQKDRANEGAKPEKDRNMPRIRELEQRMEAVKADQRKLQENIKTDYPDYYALKYPKPVSLKELQRTVLQPGEMLLLYNVMKESACLWVVSRDHFSLHAIEIDEKDLTEQVEACRNNGIALSGRDPRGRVIHARPRVKREIPNLYEPLFPEPVRKTVAFAKTLYIIPTGPLYLLPFEALQDGNGRYLIENHAVAYLSSASLLKTLRDAQARRKQNPSRPLLAFADPIYGKSETNAGILRGMRTESYRTLMGGDFAPLPETGDEVRAIRAILKAPEETMPLQLKEKASRSRVLKFHADQLLDDYRYIVFACHGILPGEFTRIEQPALVLSDPDPQTREEGFLTMADVFGLKLNADLVTLSACNTGRGKSQKGEGVMGLTRAFMYAGTPGISVTLWSVESQSAKELNVGFFRNLKEGKARADALREIKLSMIRGDHGEEWKKPYYWAPVVVFGDGR